MFVQPSLQCELSQRRYGSYTKCMTHSCDCVDHQRERHYYLNSLSESVFNRTKVFFVYNTETVRT